MNQPNKLPSSAVTTALKSELASETKSKRPSHIGFWVLALGFSAFVAWAALAPLDEGVSSPGSVTIDTKHKTIQHLSGGIVKEVLVKEGQTVQQGQVLLRLDDVTAKANYEAIRQRYLGLRAAQGRLQAERAGDASITWHPDLVQASSDPLIRQQMNTQQQLFTARRSSLESEISGTQESINGMQEQIQAYENVARNRRRQIALLQEEMDNTRGLVDQGFAPRNRLLELERSIADASASLADVEGNVQRLRHSILELRQRVLTRKQDYLKEVETQLAEVSRDVQSDDERLKSVSDDFNRTVIRSPSDGQVVGLIFQTPGGVIPPGQKIADVVPQDGALLLEAQVPPHLIDRVKQGQQVDVRFSGFANSPMLVVTGIVQSVSADAIPNPQGTASFYLARVSLTKEGLEKLGTRQMQPGMPVEVVFKGGERSLLTYLLHPLLKRVAASMKEE